MTATDKYWIYNFDQANYYLQNGLLPTKIGRGNKHVYLQFNKDEESERLFGEWCEMSKVAKERFE